MRNVFAENYNHNSRHHNRAATNDSRASRYDKTVYGNYTTD
jgi:hypothetical protein